MPAYDTQQREQSTQLLHLKTAGQGNSRNAHRAPGATGTKPVEVPGIDGSLIDALVDRLADRLASAVLAHLKVGRTDEGDESLDSREVAEYLGLDRDTLRRLAAARAIPSEQDGRGCKLFFRRLELDEWRRSGCHRRHLSAVANAA